MRFDEYYNKLLQEYDINSYQLMIGEWTDDEIQKIIQFFKEIVNDIISANLKIPSLNFLQDGSDRKNQSKGNEVEKFFTVQLNARSSSYKLRNLAGHGYPDYQLISKTPEDNYCFEVKATESWNPRDSNRRVLTSSPKKIFNAINKGVLPNAPKHLICTLIYNSETETINNVRLDFLNASSDVNVRLEASISHQLQEEGKHKKIIL